MTRRLKVFHYFITLFCLLFSSFIFSFGQSWLPHTQDYTHKFDHFMIKDGLSQATATCIFQDSKGYLWVGTEDGLNRFDGYNFKIFKNIHNDSTSLSDNGISAIKEDKLGHIWIGTFNGGLNRFNPNTGKFTRYFANLSDSTALNSNTIKKIFIDSKSRLWVANYGAEGMLLLYDPEKDNFQRHKIEYLKNSQRITTYSGTSLYEDRFGKLWLGSDEGIFIFDPQQEKFIHLIEHDPSNENSILNNHITSIYESLNGTIWVGRRGFSYGGLSKIALINSAYELNVKNYSYDPQKVLYDGNSILDISITDMVEDGDGKIWIGSKAGISIFDPFKEHFYNVIENPVNPHTIREVEILSLYKDKTGNIWFGYKNNGLSKLRYNKGFMHVQRTSNKTSGLLSNNVTCILQDRQKNLWVGSYPDGLNRITFSDSVYTSYQITHFERSPSGSGGNVLNTGTIMALHEDSLGLIWIGTQLGLYHYNGEGKGFDHYWCDPDHYEKYLDPEEIRIIFEENSSFWVGTNTGLYLKEKSPDSKTTFIRYYPIDSLASSFASPIFIDLVNDRFNNLWAFTVQGKILFFDRLQQQFKEPVYCQNIPPFNINTAHVSNENDLWIGTPNGLLRFEIIKMDLAFSLKLIKWYNEEDGLPNAMIHKILEDHRGNFWISHNKGLSKLDLITEAFVNFKEIDGLQDNEFNTNSGSHLEGGYLCFGGISGLSIFHPDSLKSNFVGPTVHLTKIKTTATEFLNPSALNRFSLDYLQNVVIFEFATFDFITPKKNQYAHQLLGFDKDWVYSGSVRTVTYTHLNPGKYTFRVKVSNNNGVWKEGASIDMVILPPPWRTWWAYSIYVIAGLILLFAARNEILKKERLESQMKLKEMEAEKYHELDTIKSRFFANISHEFRTPLTLLLGPIEKWQSKVSDPQQKEEFKTMHRNASRLLTLVNQLLDLSRLEAGTLKLKPKLGNLAIFIRTISCQFSSMADSKKIDFQIRCRGHIILCFDPEKLEKVVVNLLSNAFKFTGEGGSIHIELSKEDKDGPFESGYAEIRISDTGLGINAEDLSRIFDRFYQANNSATCQYEGSGIGLALAKELVELHQGTITATSVEGEGSLFIVRLPLGTSHLITEEFSPFPDRVGLPSATINTHPMMTLKKIHREKEVDLPRILIVEDNEDLRCYLRSYLELKYDILEASNGEVGCCIALMEIPDLVISDIMMPKMDGLELCKRLKQNEKTSHIPVILLTAKADHNSKIFGFGIRADDFIAKPFNAEELIARIENLIEIRKMLQQKFSKQIELKPSEITVESLDTKFLKRVILIIEEHLDDELFNVDLLSKENNMSSNQLYRKLKALTGCAPNDVIRNIRLERAASLLEQNVGNVAEVAFRVGFNNLSYFSKCFREKFNTTPREFQKAKL
jgi:signal transduction histidine kinase/ligand-binding sensor domain-containing protein/AraC-like DNA-binding protein